MIIIFSLPYNEENDIGFLGNDFKRDYANRLNALIDKIKIFKKKMENKEIGTVEPIGGVSGYHFILGAIHKYGEDSQYHKSLLEYIKGISELNMHNDLC